MKTENMKGEWGKTINLDNVAVHVSLLPTGNILYWGRRSVPGSMVGATLNEHFTRAFILEKNPKGEWKSTPTATEPIGPNGKTVNLFCSGHCFQPDGTLLVVGGHILDGKGLDQTCVYDPFAKTWTPKDRMVGGRWYPSVITLSDGSVFSVSGSEWNGHINLVPQIWDTKTWQSTQTPLDDIFNLYPRLYHDPKGRIFMAGPAAQSRFLDLSLNQGVGEWSKDNKDLQRDAGQREYAASAMYDEGKIIYIGGGGGDYVPPSNMAEIIDLKEDNPKWTKAKNIEKGRRHHFATTLPDGTVLVTGGTQGKGFNDLSPGQPVHEPELWDPVKDTWTSMAPEDWDRCYHHTALLLPDGTVFSAGGGEYDPGNNGIPNDPKDSITTAQVFSPPYLFYDGDRPTIGNLPTEIDYNQVFTITVGPKDKIGKVSWVRIGSVTHACNMNQSFTFLHGEQKGTNVTITGPSNSNIVPPGHYMLFVLNDVGKPAVAPIIRLKPDPNAQKFKPHVASTSEAAADQHVNVTLAMRNDKVVSQQDRPPVVVGLTPACPYGLGPCWGGAYEALRNMNDIEVVRPMPDPDNSLAYVYLRWDIVPDIDAWRDELRKLDGGTYQMRGIEMTLTGVVTSQLDGANQILILTRTSNPSRIILAPFKAESKIEWDNSKKAPKPMSDEEAGAYTRLSKTLAGNPSGLNLEVTGRLQKHKDNNYSLDVRTFVVVDTATSS